jgi:arsenite-transporting ATPase
VRLVLVTGGGGAGVTTFAAATAVRAATRGATTRLLGVEPAAFDAVLDPRTELPATLHVDWGDPTAIFAEDAAPAAAWFQALLGWAGLDGALAEDAGSLPLVRTVAVLLAAVEGDATFRVVDLGPVAEALPVLQLLCMEPASGSTGRLDRLAGTVAGPLLARLADLPQPSEAVRRAGERAMQRVALLRSLLRDRAATSLRLVLPSDGRAEGIARETRTLCGLWGIGLDMQVTRPDAVGSVYGTREPQMVLSAPPEPRVELRDGGADLIIPVPHRPAGEFSVRRRGVDLAVRAGRWRRTFRLPPVLQPLHGRRAWHDGEVFRVRFEKTGG